MNHGVTERDHWNRSVCNHAQHRLAHPVSFFDCGSCTTLISLGFPLRLNALSCTLSSHSHLEITRFAMYSKTMGTVCPDLAEVRKSFGPRSRGRAVAGVEVDMEAGRSNRLGVMVTEEVFVEALVPRCQRDPGDKLFRVGREEAVAVCMGEEGAETYSSNKDDEGV